MPQLTSVSDAILNKPDLLEREKSILLDVQKRLDFTPQKRLGDSRYWVKTYAGAVFYLGTFQDQPAVLKIQGVKPPVSEVDNLQAFAAQNTSALIRPPQLLSFLRWDNKRRYEALVLEHVTGQPAIGFPTTTQEVTRFFKLYQDYRLHCRNNPWLPKPAQSLSRLVEADFTNWRYLRRHLFPSHPLFESTDDPLIDQAIQALMKGYEGIQPTFLHGHFSHADLLQQGNQWVLFSNLFWKYKAPYYDAVFAQHWFVYHLAQTKGMTPARIQSQHQLWLDALSQIPHSIKETRLLTLAFLERATAGLNLDVLSLDQQNPLTPYLFNYTRQRIQDLISLLS